VNKSRSSYPPKSTKQFAAASTPQIAPASHDEPSCLISKAEVLRRVGVSYPTLWRWVSAGNFPRARNLGGKSAWIEHEVTAWINARPLQPIKPVAEKAEA
jgi:predicted DNA-binding transcriptional regulator AlpA